ncbi:PH domain-containing protein [Frankia sp. Cas4]|uniref:PH domain-containing protein n=1 Tax=Frankia sp. Cas4 TaxID=3073927 RepID=UPI002AD4735A|nr:PH domain-containing protein [Frankia sp. Cas4]
MLGDMRDDEFGADEGGADEGGADQAGIDGIIDSHIWSPPWWRVIVYAAAGMVVLAVAAIGSLAFRLGSLDGPGRLLVAIGGAGLIVLAVRDALARPALRVDDGGIDLVDGIHRLHLPWAAVLRVRADILTHNRRGVHIRVLTVETLDGPLLLSRRQLGTEPERVAAAVEAVRRRHG